MNFLEELNPAQKEAVISTEGPLLILAGAGSGKTKVITYRIAYLIMKKDVDPENILAITFTNKAANEMKERVEGLIGDIAKDVWIYTFHKACIRILRRDVDKIGFSRSFVIFDTNDQISLISDCIKDLNLSEEQFKPKSILECISRAKESLIEPEEYQRVYGENFRNAKIQELYHRYQERLQKNNALDFDDIISYTIKLFKTRPDVLGYYQEKFKYIMVDEYQDTNMSQYYLIHLLSLKHRNVCVVGDDDQSIYGWRGADIRNILEFEKDFKGAKVIKLEQNYRSTQYILNAANNVIKNNKGRKAKNLWTQKLGGEKIRLLRAKNEHEEIQLVVNEIKRLKEKEGRRNRDFAILYRINAQSRVAEEVMLMNNIPYKIVGGFRFYDRKEIKDILAYLRVLVNPYDDVSFRRIINTPKRGIGINSIDMILDFADSKRMDVYTALLNIEEIPNMNARIRKKVREFVDLINGFMKDRDRLSVFELTLEILDKTGYIRELEQDTSMESRDRLENIKEFLGVIKEFEKNSIDKSLEAFLTEVSLISDLDSLTEGQDAVIMMTLHSAKGLEFPVVFIVGMEEGIFPYMKALRDPEEMEEERRLCYVGITRAKERLYFSYCENRYIFGYNTMGEVSRFIREIPKDLIEEALPYRLFEDEREALKVGQRVEHKIWGLGTIIEKSGYGDNMELVIDFEKVGIKRLLASLAPINPL